MRKMEFVSDDEDDEEEGDVEISQPRLKETLPMAHRQHDTSQLTSSASAKVKKQTKEDVKPVIIDLTDEPSSPGSSIKSGNLEDLNEFKDWEEPNFSAEQLKAIFENFEHFSPKVGHIPGHLGEDYFARFLDRTVSRHS